MKIKAWAIFHTDKKDIAEKIFHTQLVTPSFAMMHRFVDYYSSIKLMPNYIRINFYEIQAILYWMLGILILHLGTSSSHGIIK